MNNFTFEETNLLCIYNTGSRTGLIDALTEMRGELSPEEAELRRSCRFEKAVPANAAPGWSEPLPNPEFPLTLDLRLAALAT